MRGWRRYIALSPHWLPRLVRSLYRGLHALALPAPRWLFRPLLLLWLALRETYYFLVRILLCEPLFKAYCTRYGKQLRTGVFLHWVQGDGDLIIGDHVTIDGKCNFFFAARYAERPQLRIGDHCGFGHECSFVVGRSIIIGNHVRFAAGIQVFDTPGHPLDPEARRAGAPAREEDVRPVVIGDNAWIGTNAIIYPGVTIGENSVVANGAVVMSSVPPNVVVAGNPARQIRALPLTPDTLAS